MKWVSHLRAAWATLRGDRTTSLALHHSIVDAEPDDPAALWAVLGDYREKGQVAEVVVLCERVLARDASNFAALDALVWAYVTQGDHHNAKITLERAACVLAELKVLEVFSSRGLRMTLAATQALSQLPGVRRVAPHIPSADQFRSETERWVGEWNAWANAYFVWYGQEYGQR